MARWALTAALISTCASLSLPLQRGWAGVARRRLVEPPRCTGTLDGDQALPSGFLSASEFARACTAHRNLLLLRSEAPAVFSRAPSATAFSDDIVSLDHAHGLAGRASACGFSGTSNLLLVRTLMRIRHWQPSCSTCVHTPPSKSQLLCTLTLQVLESDLGLELARGREAYLSLFSAVARLNSSPLLDIAGLRAGMLECNYE
eukprot:scaffold324580_cov64-Tisochrysis_lutea.AAC.2